MSLESLASRLKKILETVEIDRREAQRAFDALSIEMRGSPLREHDGVLDAMLEVEFVVFDHPDSTLASAREKIDDLLRKRGLDDTASRP